MFTPQTGLQPVCKEPDYVQHCSLTIPRKHEPTLTSPLASTEMSSAVAAV